MIFKTIIKRIFKITLTTKINLWLMIGTVATDEDSTFIDSYLIITSVALFQFPQAAETSYGDQTFYYVKSTAAKLYH